VCSKLLHVTHLIKWNIPLECRGATTAEKLGDQSPSVPMVVAPMLECYIQDGKCELGAVACMFVTVEKIA